MDKQNKYAAAANRAQLQTDEEYRNVISSLTRLRDDELDEFFPERADKEKLLDLLEIVNSSSNTNQKVLELKENSEKFGAITFKLLRLLI